MVISYAGAENARAPRTDKRYFAGQIEDKGYSYGEVMGFLRQTIKHILIEHPGFQPQEIHLRHTIEDDDDRVYAAWHWSVRIA